MYGISASPLRLFLCGDVMLGRGVDQILAHSCPDRIYEPVVDSALDYVRLAERASGPIPRLVDAAYVWGAALEVLADTRPQARIINLETSITTSDRPLSKDINYRMHPANVDVLQAAAIDCCTLANNHVLDWGVAGLGETLTTLAAAGIAHAGAGRNEVAARTPALLGIGTARRVVIVACGAADSGVPASWAAGPARPGVFQLADFSDGHVSEIADVVRSVRRPGDIVVASIHWGGNWGYEISAQHRSFAHALIERAAIDLVHGHSSHHARGIEVYRNHLIVYGCGDFINDYEGIEGYDEFRSDLVLMYLPAIDGDTGHLERLELVPLQLQRFRLQRVEARDRAWLLHTLDRECRRLGSRVVPKGEHFVLDWTA